MDRKFLALSSVIAFGVGGAAQAAQTLQLDLNSLTAQAQDSGGAAVAFGGESHTGSISLGMDANAMLAGIQLNGTSIGPVPEDDWSLDSLTGSIALDNGEVDGGSFTITVLNSVTSETDTYSAGIVAGSGDVNDVATGFSLDGLTFNGAFSDSTFAGVDVSDWVDNEPLGGSFTHFAFTPDAGGFDNDANMDVFIPVPLPTPAAMGAAGLLGLGTIRRRRA